MEITDFARLNYSVGDINNLLRKAENSITSDAAATLIAATLVDIKNDITQIKTDILALKTDVEALQSLHELEEEEELGESPTPPENLTGATETPGGQELGQEESSSGGGTGELTSNPTESLESTTSSSGTDTE